MNITAVLLTTTFILLLGLFLRLVTKWYIVYKAREAKVTELDPLLTGLQPGKPAIVYFTSPGCGPCRLVQTPILKQLQKEHGNGLQILTVNIEEQLADALRWGVMKVPRTFILDRNLRPFSTNLDVAKIEQLKQQLEAASK